MNVLGIALHILDFLGTRESTLTFNLESSASIVLNQCFSKMWSGEMIWSLRTQWALGAPLGCSPTFA